jgi:hypothetical protein
MGDEGFSLSLPTSLIPHPSSFLPHPYPMWFRRPVTVIAALAFGIWDACVSTWFPGMMTAVTFSLPFVVVLSAFSVRERAITAAIASGIMLDIFLPSNAGMVSMRFLLVALAVYSLRRYVFTNRSLIGAAVLGAFAVLLNRILLLTIEPLQSFLGRSVIPESTNPFWTEFIWMLVVTGLVFVLFALFTRRFLPLVSRAAERGEGSSF